MRNTNANRIVALAALVFAATGASTAVAGEPPRLPAYGFERIEGSTVAALRVAYGREMNARKDYEIFARVADREGRPRAATLFRAIATGEETHARLHAANLERLGAGPPEWSPTSVTIGTTAEHLARAIEAERAERDAVYRVYTEYARLECRYDASIGFAYSGRAEATHAAMFAGALDELNRETTRPRLLASLVPVSLPGEDGDGGPVAFVCPACGSAFHARPARHCPSCHGRSDAMKVFL